MDPTAGSILGWANLGQMMIAMIFAGDDEDAEKDTDWSKNTE